MAARVRFRGHWTCSCMAEWLPVWEAYLKHLGVIRVSVDIYQLIGNAPASAGFHKAGAAGDFKQYTTTAVKAARNGGAASWHRGRADGMRPDHNHLVLKGCPHLVAGAKGQITSLENGRNGLVNNGADRGPRTGVQWPLRTWQQGIAWMKEQMGDTPAPKPTTTVLDLALWNVASPKPGWFPYSWDSRKEAIGQQLASMSCSVVACCETHYSYQTADINRALGDQYAHVSSPIGNDLFYDRNKYTQTRAFKEYSLGAQNRYAGVLHLTREQTGAPLTFVHTHFPYGSATARATAARNLVALLADVEHTIIVSGDFNNQSFSPSSSPHGQLRRAGYEFLREQTRVANGSAPEYPKKGQWLSDIATDKDRHPGARLTSGDLFLTSPKLSDHRPIRARVEIK